MQQNYGEVRTPWTFLANLSQKICEREHGRHLPITDLSSLIGNFDCGYFTQCGNLAVLLPLILREINFG